jgi:DNA repair protein RecO (recombination protein O)
MQLSSSGSWKSPILRDSGALESPGNLGANTARKFSMAKSRHGDDLRTVILAFAFALMEQTPAILLRKMPWSETSLILVWLTERFGTVRTVARGARRPRSPFAGMLDVFYCADISFTLSRKGDLHALREASLRTVFDVSAAGNAGFYVAAYFAELAGIAAPPMHPAPQIFDLLQRGIHFVQRAPVSIRAVNHFEAELCRVLGVHDAAGKVRPIDALASLYGTIPESRQLALKFFEKNSEG